jgi:hypothetical protein
MKFGENLQLEVFPFFGARNTALLCAMQSQYFEVIFSGSHGGVTRIVRVCVELNDADKMLFSSGRSTELITQANGIVFYSEPLDEGGPIG